MKASIILCRNLEIEYIATWVHTSLRPCKATAHVHNNQSNTVTNVVPYLMLRIWQNALYLSPCLCWVASGFANKHADGHTPDVFSSDHIPALRSANCKAGTSIQPCQSVWHNWYARVCTLGLACEFSHADRHDGGQIPVLHIIHTLPMQMRDNTRCYLDTCACKCGAVYRAQ